jgi:hypothetical protein
VIFKRIAALIVAVGLVVSAISVRKALDDDGGGTATPSDSTDASSPGDLGQIVCIEDLRAACSGFDGVTIEPWIATVDRLAAGDQIAAWITLAPLSALVPDLDETEALSASPLVFFSRPDRHDAFVAACAAESAWKCLGEDAGDAWDTLGGQSSWGKVIGGLPDPATSAVGAIALGAIAAGYFGDTTFTSRTIDGDDGFSGWFSAFSKAVPAVALQSPAALLIRRPSAVNVAIDTEAMVTATAGDRLDEFAVIEPTPLTTATVVAVTTAGTGLGDLPDGLLEAVRNLWAGTPPVDDASNSTVSAATLVRLEQLWEDTR